MAFIQTIFPRTIERYEREWVIYSLKNRNVYFRIEDFVEASEALLRVPQPAMTAVAQNNAQQHARSGLFRYTDTNGIKSRFFITLSICLNVTLCPALSSHYNVLS